MVSQGRIAYATEKLLALAPPGTKARERLSEEECVALCLQMGVEMVWEESGDWVIARTKEQVGIVNDSGKWRVVRGGPAAGGVPYAHFLIPWNFCLGEEEGGL